MMELLETTHDKKKFIIEEDYPEVGCYLYIYDGSNCIKDYLQDNIETCKRVAFENYGAPQNGWKKAGIHGSGSVLGKIVKEVSQLHTQVDKNE